MGVPHRVLLPVRIRGHFRYTGSLHARVSCLFTFMFLPYLDPCSAEGF